MKRLKGPELKMPELKTPDFLLDLYYDLRDRRLLPFVALALVAIAAVPFLLGGKSDEQEAPDTGGSLAALGSEKTSKLTVVEATPGLRDYHKRLGHRSPTDPFKQQYTGLPASAQVEGTQSEATSSAGSGSTVISETGTTEVSETGSSGSGSGSHGGGSGSSGGGAAGETPPKPNSGSLRIFEYVFDLQIVHTETSAGGSTKMSEPEARHRVKTLTQLPSKKVVVATVAGINFHTGKVYFLVAHEVHSLGGEFKCVTRAPGELCELLEIEPGFPLELTFGPNKVVYRIKVTGIHAVWAGKAGDKRSNRRAGFAAQVAGHSRGSSDGQNFSK